MNKDQIDNFFEIVIDADNGKYDDDEQQAITKMAKLLQLSETDQNYIKNSLHDIEDIFNYICSIAIKQIEIGDYEYFKSKINNADSDELYVYDYLLPYSYDFDTKKNYIKQCYTIGERVSVYRIEELLNIMDILKSETNSLNINKILNEQQDFVKWCVENGQEIGLNRLDINDVIDNQQEFIELCIENAKEMGINISDIVSESQRLVEWCIKNNQQIGLNESDLKNLMAAQFERFTWCIENAKDIALNYGNLGFLIQSYQDLCVEAIKNNIYPMINVNSLEDITKWYNENEDINKSDVSHFINEFCKKCIDELYIDSTHMINIIKNNINDPEYVKRINRKTKTIKFNI